ncbi:MAG: IS256 family transposase [Gammaproteobacteria bacterium]
MACRVQDKPFAGIFEVLSEQGFAGMREAAEKLLNEVAKLERAAWLGAEPYERSEARRGYANGFKPKTVKSRLGALALEVPQTRDGGFYPTSLEKGLRSERALKLALAEMYVKGVSTRKMAAVTEQLCGLSVNSTEVSRAAAALDETLEAWRNRPLGRFAYVFLDARYEKVREAGEVRDMAVLVAIGVNARGRREILGVSAALSEAEVHWREFLSGLAERGLKGLRLIVSDAHEGLKAARRAVWPGVAWQRCQFHLQQNAQAYVPRQGMKREVAAAIHAIFNAPDEPEARRLLEAFLKRYAQSAPKLVAWAETALPEGFTVFAFPEAHRRRLRTSNICERVNKEIRRRTRVATLFPNEASCLRLASAVAMEISEEWVTGRAYLDLTQ